MRPRAWNKKTRVVKCIDRSQHEICEYKKNKMCARYETSCSCESFLEIVPWSYYARKIESFMRFYKHSPSLECPVFSGDWSCGFFLGGGWKRGVFPSSRLPGNSLIFAQYCSYDLLPALFMTHAWEAFKGTTFTSSFFFSCKPKEMTYFVWRYRRSYLSL